LDLVAIHDGWKGIGRVKALYMCL